MVRGAPSPPSPLATEAPEETRALRSAIRALAQSTSEAWRRHGYDERAFSDVAADALQSSDLVGVLDWATLQDHILSSSSPEPLLTIHPAPEVITLYEERHFKIYAHLWLDNIAQAHHHSWAGAFQVLEGRSLNGYSKFTCSEVVRQGLSLGRLEPAHHTINEPGTVVKVIPGPEFIHSIQYFERPGIAISLRGGRPVTDTRTYYRPGLSIQSELTDPGLTSMLRVLQALHLTDRPSFDTRLEALVPELDLMSIHILLSEAIRSGWSLPSKPFEVAREKFGRRFEIVEGAANDLTTLDKFVQLRSRFVDPDLRFFLAALYLSEDRSSVRSLAEEYAPEQDAEECVGSWLTTLLIEAEDSDAGVPDGLIRGLGALALGTSLDDVRRRLEENEKTSGSPSAKELESVLTSTHRAMANAPIYRALFR